MTRDWLRESTFPRRLDRILGTPVLALLGAARSKRQMPREVSRVGIMVFEAIGDTLVASTIIATLRAHKPGLQVIAFVSRGNLPALRLVDGVDRVVEVPLLRPLQALRAMRSVPVDVMIDIGQWPRWYAFLCAASRARFTIGFDTPGQGRQAAFDMAVPHRRDVHELQNLQALLTPLGTGVPVAPADALRRPGPVPARLGLRTPYVVFHPWAGGFRGAEREWPDERWVALAQHVAATGHEVVVTGAPADRPRAQALAAQMACGARVLAGECDLPETAAVLAGARAAVCVNTGTMHLASLLDVPLVALHGPTARLRWGPLGRRSIALAPEPGSDTEFLHLGFEYPRLRVHCMERLSVGLVWDALRGMLQHAPAQDRTESAP